MRMFVSISDKALVAGAQPALPTPWGTLCLSTDCGARNKMNLRDIANKSLVCLVRFAPLLKVRISLSHPNHSFSAFRARARVAHLPWTITERSFSGAVSVKMSFMWGLWIVSMAKSCVCEHLKIPLFAPKKKKTKWATSSCLVTHTT